MQSPARQNFLIVAQGPTIGKDKRCRTTSPENASMYNGTMMTKRINILGAVQPSACHREEGRPVRRRSRTFRPNYLSFAGTYQCNLTCPHCCVPIEWPDRLDIDAAVRFLEDAHAYGIGILGFTGGEPFLYSEFLHSLCRRAAILGFRFDKIVTNGVWFRDSAELQGVL